MIGNIGALLAIDYRKIRPFVCQFVLLSYMAQVGLSQSRDSNNVTSVIEISVLRTARVSLEVDDVNAILKNASAIITDEYQRLHPSSRTNIVFRLKLQPTRPSSSQRRSTRPTIPTMPPLDPDFLIRAHFTTRAVEAIRQSEKSGSYGSDAIEATIGARRGNLSFEVDVVEALQARECPPIRYSGEQLSPDLHLVGCSGRSTTLLVLQFPRELASRPAAYAEWARREGLLWAHEICHLLGLPDLDPKVLMTKLPKLQGHATRYLMMPPYQIHAEQLLLEESNGIVTYPRNENELADLFNYLKTLGQPLPK